MLHPAADFVWKASEVIPIFDAHALWFYPEMLVLGATS
jgi:hypothetical protein